MIIITGPTGVGKSDYAINIASKISGEIINGDVGQFYTSLSLGTAKPNWRVQKIPHHLFDSVDNPINITVIDFLERVRACAQEIRARGHVPVVVGGSSFYVYSLFFPPQAQSVDERRGGRVYDQATQNLWHELSAIDPERAAHINLNDRYRITRALDIWHGCAIKPSMLKPRFAPITCPVLLLIVNRERPELYARINERVNVMLDSGWIDEVAGLSAEWHEFLLQKKLIGYDDIVRFLKERSLTKIQLAALIAQKTRAYAKRQLTFNRMMIKKVEEHADCVYTELVNLTHTQDVPTKKSIDDMVKIIKN